MFMQYSTFLEVFLGILGFGLAIMFCTTLCRACSRLREEQITREAIRRSEQDGRLQSIYFIPFPRSVSQQDSEDQHDGDDLRPPRYSTTVYPGPPPAYNELEFKPDDLPPAYNEHSIPVYASEPPPPPPHLTVQPQSQP